MNEANEPDRISVGPSQKDPDYFSDHFQEAIRIVVNAADYADVRAQIERGDMPWWTGTFFYFMKFLDEDSCFLEFSVKGMQLFIDLAERSPEKYENRKVSLRIAREEKKRGFAGLYGRHTVSLWNMLDATLSESLTQLLLAKGKTLELPAFQKIKFSVAQFQDMSSAQMMRAVLGELKRLHAAEARCNKGVRIYEKLYIDAGMSEHLSDQLDKRLIELRAVRNAIVHNMGIADERFVKDCPWLRIEPGTRIAIGKAQYDVYTDAASSYVVSTLVDLVKTFQVLEESAPPNQESG